MGNNLGNKETMAINIKYELERHSKTATDVCADLGFPKATFSNWCNALTYPRIDKIEMMANYFGISKADLVEERTTETPLDELIKVAKHACDEDIEITINVLKALNEARALKNGK